MIIFLAAIGSGCGKNDTTKPTAENNYGFQSNVDREEEFEIFSVMKDGRALEEIYNTLDGKEISSLLEGVMEEPDENGDDNIDEFISFSRTAADLLQDNSDLITKLLNSEAKSILEWLTGNNSEKQVTLFNNYTIATSYSINAFYPSGEEAQFTDYFYDFLDTLSEEAPDGSKSGMEEITDINYKLFSYFIDTRTKGEVRDDIQDIVDDLLDKDFFEDFTDISKLIGKMLIQTDYPIWIDDEGNSIQRKNIDPTVHTNTGVGNVVSGVNLLVKWVNKMMMVKENRDIIAQVIREITNLFNPELAAQNKKILKTLIYNMEDYFTAGGKIYETDPTYNGNDDEIYSNTELGQTLREIFPGLVQLMLRSDREASMMVDNEWKKQVYPIHQMVKYLRNLKFDPDEIDIERSLFDLLKYDLYGNDRTNPDTGAHAISFLENLLFTVTIGNNTGWEDGGTTGEIDPLAPDSRKDHGHGKTVDYLTLNNCLFSMKTHALLELGEGQGFMGIEDGTAFLGLYDMALRPTDGENISRSYNPFHRTEMAESSFYYDQNYGALSFVAGAAIGDAGTPDGGNRTGPPLEMNTYKAYNPTGRGEIVTAQWVNSWVTRICFNGEGPFYYADPEAKAVTINGKSYYKYMRPNGKVYALVNKDSSTWKYIYPTDKGDAEDESTNKVYDFNEKRERFNRYKAEWDSEYYMIKYQLLFGNTYQIPTFENSDLKIKSAGQAGNAGALHFIEAIPENELRRACSSPMEAFFRNYQWLWHEKKIAFIIPLYLSIDLADLGLGNGKMPLGCAFQVLEGNGLSGLGNLRKFRDNHVWAKKGEKGLSNIPGDYRLSFAASIVTDPIDPFGFIGSITENLIYSTVFDVGGANPSIIGKNIPAIARFSFPRSPTMDRGNGVIDRQLGSLEFKVGDEIWKKKNEFLPVFVSLLSAIYDNTVSYPQYADPEYHGNLKHGGKNFIENLTPLLTPLFYYQKNEGQPPYNNWKPRIQGELESHFGNHIGNNFLQSSAEFYDKDNKLTDWDGCEKEKKYYLPAAVRTPVNTLIDSDLTKASTRMDGILPVVLKETKVISYLVKLLLSETNDTDELPAALEQIMTAIKTTKGEATKFYEGTASYGPGGSGKQVRFPNWMFTRGVEDSKDEYSVYQSFTECRSEDLIFDNALDLLIGADKVDDKNEGYGLANCPDDKPTIHHQGWDDFEDDFDTLVDLLFKDSKYSLIENIVNIIEALLGKEIIYTDEQIKGFLFCMGKLFANYDLEKEKWVYQGEKGYDDIYKLLTGSLPNIHDELKDDTGENYWNLLTISKDMMKPDGLLNFILDTVIVEAGWKEVFEDLEAFLNRDFIINEDPLWSTVAELLTDLADSMEESKDGDKLEQIYRDYGFQMN